MQDVQLRRTRGLAFVLGIAATIAGTGCGGESTQTGNPVPLAPADATSADVSQSPLEAAPPDDGGFAIDLGVDTTAPDTAEPTDTGVPDTAVEDTGPEDTGPEDTGPEDTGPEDTGPEDTGPEDTGPEDTGPEDTGPEDTGPEDTGPADTGTVDTWSPPVAPTVTITMPAADAKLGYSKSSDACQGQTFRVGVEAPGGLKSLQWKFFTPNAAGASTGMLGTCNGLAAYGFFMDPTKYLGVTSATFEEDVAIAGLYSGTAGSGRWWWCTAPGTGTTSFVESPPTPGAGGVQTLSNYCAAKSTPPDSDLASRWRLEVIAVDLHGNTTKSELWFWVHQ